MDDISNPGVLRIGAVGVNNPQKIAGPCELTSIKLIPGGVPAAVSVYDGTSSVDVVDANLKWFMSCPNNNPDFQNFNSPLLFKKGVVVVLEEGAGGNEVLSFSARNYLAK